MAMLISVGLVMIWLCMTVALLGGLWVLPVSTVVPLRPRVRPWLWRYLRGEQGLWHTLRVGLALAGTGWWNRATGFPLSPDVYDGGVLLLGATVLIALFNVGRTGAFSSGRSAVLCGALALGWMGWWGVLLNALYRD